MVLTILILLAVLKFNKQSFNIGGYVMKKDILIVSGLMVLLSTFFFIFMMVNKIETKSTKAMLIPASGLEILDLIDEKKDGIIYVGRPTCNKCQDFQPKLEKAIVKNNQDIFYYNTDEGKKKDIKNFEKLIHVTDIQSVPAVLVVEKGKVTIRLSNFKNQNEIDQFLLENKG